MNLIRTKLQRIHRRIVVNACVENREEMFINVGDIHPDGQHFQIFCQFKPTKQQLVGHFEFDPDVTSQDSWEDCGPCMHCVKCWKQIFIDVGDMHPDGQNFQILCQFEQTFGHFEFDLL